MAHERLGSQPPDVLDGTKFGLVVFGLVLLIENTVAIYFFSSMRSLYAHSLVARVTIASMRALQFLALAVLAVVTAK